MTKKILLVLVVLVVVFFGWYLSRNKPQEVPVVESVVSGPSFGEVFGEADSEQRTCIENGFGAELFAQLQADPNRTMFNAEELSIIETCIYSE